MKTYKKYLYESNVSAATEGKKITEKIINSLWVWLKRHQFTVNDIELIDFLNKVSPSDIYFEYQHHPRALGNFVSYGKIRSSLPDRARPEVGITLDLEEGISDYLRRFAKEDNQKMFFDIKKNIFYKELYQLLSHELVHKLQLIKSNWKVRWNWTAMDSKYTSVPGEIDAFALQAALEMIHDNKSMVKDIYSHFRDTGKITDKVYKKFMKKMTMNIKELKKLGMA